MQTFVPQTIPQCVNSRTQSFSKWCIARQVAKKIAACNRAFTVSISFSSGTLDIINIDSTVGNVGKVGVYYASLGELDESVRALQRCLTFIFDDKRQFGDNVIEWSGSIKYECPCGYIQAIQDHW